MKRRLLLIGLLFFGLTSIYAASVAPNWNFSKADSFPSSLIVGQTYTLPLSITNQNTIPLIISAILPNTIAGLTIPSTNDCVGVPIAAGASCNFNATYTPISAGTVNLEIQLAAFGYLWKQKKSINLTATSAETTAIIASSVTNISLAPSTVVNWTITNSSSTVTATNITTVLPSPLSNYATVNTCATTAPGATCTLTLTVNADLPKNLTGTLTAQGSNTNALSASYETSNSLSIAVESDSQYQHLAYQAIKVTNIDTADHTISAIAATLPSNIIQCDSTASNCDNNSAFASTCAANTELAPNASCHIWYKSLTGSTIGATTTPVNLVVTTNGATVSGNFNFNYENDLYVGGSFYQAGGNTANNIAKWNGSSWSSLGAGFSNSPYSAEVSSLSMFKGDLYAGGVFNQADSETVGDLAKWNGAAWSNVGTEPVVQDSDEGVLALAVFNNRLYIGGAFDHVAGQSMFGIASWDGTTWSTVGTAPTVIVGTVISLNVIGNNLYATGQFNNAGDIVLNNIAKWDGSNWSALGEGVQNATLNSLTSIGNDLYVGGEDYATFTPYFGKWNGSSWSRLSTGDVFSNYIKALTALGNNLYATSNDSVAKWNGNSWSPLSDSFDGAAFSVLATVGTDLYVGGSFIQIGTVSTQNIAKWDGSNWSALGSNDLNGNNVEAIMAAPSLTISSN